MDDRFFLIQRVEREQYGQQITGIEIISHEHPFGGEPSEDARSCFHHSQGKTHVYCGHGPCAGCRVVAANRLDLRLWWWWDLDRQLDERGAL
jgi:hypothetical protein